MSTIVPLATSLAFAITLIMPQKGVDGTCGPPPRRVIAKGKPNYRHPRLTPEIVANQLEYGKIHQFQLERPLAGYIGLVDCSRIGQYVGVTWPDGTDVYPYLVVDCRARCLPPLPEEGWIAAAEFDQGEWEQHYNWTLFAERQPITVWRYLPETGDCSTMLWRQAFATFVSSPF